MRLLWFCLALVSSCTCRPTVTMVEEAPLVVAPTSVRFADTFIGASAVAELEVTNPSRVARPVTVELPSPFSLEAVPDSLPSGGTLVRVRFTPTSAGEAGGVLRLGALKVPLSGLGLAPLSCDSQNVCTAARFDPVSGRCVSSAKPDGEACQTRCVTGQCLSERCEGASIACPETRCTVGVCNEDTGCGVVARACAPPSNPCQRARCDDTTGCLTEEAEDGVVCGVDDCRLDSVNVCIAGQCVMRARPGVGRCTRTWLPLDLGHRTNPTLGYDVVGRRVLLFGGGGSYSSSDDTWAWDGQRWALLIPANSPSPRRYAHAAHDELRRRLVLFGGQTGSSVSNETWEWDGTTWLLRATTGPTPPGRWGHAIVWDGARQRTVLFSGGGSGYLSDLWEWNGLSWRQLQPAVMPRRRVYGEFVYDPVRRVSVLFGGTTNSGGSDEHLVDTWEWDGTTWTEKSAPPFQAQFGSNSLAWDPISRRVLLFRATVQTFELWAYDGTWTQVMTPTLPRVRSASMALDPLRRRLVLVGGLETWEWDGQRFSLIVSPAVPYPTLPLVWDPLVGSPLAFGADGRTPWHFVDGGWVTTSPVDAGPDERSQASLTFDAARQRFVLFGGLRQPGLTQELWEWDGASWSLPPPGSAPCERPASAYDPVRARTVYAGCPLPDGGHAAWEWDGTSWTVLEESPTASLMAWDGTRQQLVLLDERGRTWVRTGTTWAVKPDAGVVPQLTRSITYDPVRGLLVLVASRAFNDPQTWEWNGTAWNRPVLAHQPAESSTLYGGTLIYDVTGRRTLSWAGTFYEYIP